MVSATSPVLDSVPSNIQFSVATPPIRSRRVVTRVVAMVVAMVVTRVVAMVEEAHPISLLVVLTKSDTIKIVAETIVETTVETTVETKAYSLETVVETRVETTAYSLVTIYPAVETKKAVVGTIV